MGVPELGDFLVGPDPFHVFASVIVLLVDQPASGRKSKGMAKDYGHVFGPFLTVYKVMCVGLR